MRMPSDVDRIRSRSWSRQRPSLSGRKATRVNFRRTTRTMTMLPKSSSEQENRPRSPLARTSLLRRAATPLAQKAGGVLRTRMSAWTEYARFPLTLFMILTPIAAIPVYMNLTNGQDPLDKARVTRAVVLTVLVVLGCAALVGDVTLLLFGSSLDAFRVGGGIALLLMGLSKLARRASRSRHNRHGSTQARGRAAIGVAPLGTPLLAGPGAISTVIIHCQRSEGLGHLGIALASIVLVCALLWLTLVLGPPIGRRLGTTGITVVDRIAGLFLAALAVELIATGLRALFPGLA
jgi:multiple antibiotic resistance protein